MRNEWMAKARCRDMNPELFFDQGNEFKAAKINPIAAKACSECKVRDQCYVYALKHESFGYWAGTTPPERRRLRKAAGITLEPMIIELKAYAPHGSDARYNAHRRLGEDPCDLCKDGHARWNNPEGKRHVYTAQENRETKPNQQPKESKTERLRQGASGDYSSALGTSRRSM